MHGEIWCDAVPGGGTCFGFSLPLHEAPAGAEAAKWSQASLRAEGAR